jgi:hypothetical protein
MLPAIDRDPASLPRATPPGCSRTCTALCIGDWWEQSRCHGSWIILIIDAVKGSHLVVQHPSQQSYRIGVCKDVGC